MSEVLAMSRSVSKERATKETQISLRLGHRRPGTGGSRHRAAVFRPHDLPARPPRRLRPSLSATGDLAVDAHHTVEDVGIVLGEALHEALGDKAGVRRFASIAVPLDEALIEVALDLSGRPFLVYEVDPGAGGEAYPIGDPPFDPQLAEEFWRAFCTSAAITLHIRMRSGRNTHHILEASFKAVAAPCVTRSGSRAAACLRQRVFLGEAVRSGRRLRDRQPALGRKGSLQGRCRCPPGHRARPRSPRPTASCCPGSGNFGRCSEALSFSGLWRATVDGGHVGASRSSGYASGCNSCTRGRRNRPGSRA